MLFQLLLWKNKEAENGLQVPMEEYNKEHYMWRDEKEKIFILPLSPRFSLTVTCAGHSYALLYIWANREIETLVGDLPQIPHVLITELEPAESQNWCSL